VGFEPSVLHNQKSGHAMHAADCQPTALVLSVVLVQLVAYLGGARCGAPLWPDHENFLQATLYEKVRFLPFFSKSCKIQQCLMVYCVSKFQKNWQICGFHWTFRSKKCFSFRGLRPADPPTRGSAPEPRWGLRPQTPVIGSRSARSPWPPFAKS